ncbi:MAG: dienelactone hydrolase family protein [Haloechinothrix sp.]
MTVPLTVETGDASLDGVLTVPADSMGVVIFAHGSGSSRHSPRNQAVARSLQDQRLATLLFDLLRPDEEQADELTGKYRFDIEFLARRLLRAIDQIRDDPTTRGLPMGLFGASAGAAVALLAAARRSELIGAVVSRGGRPDLAGSELRAVRAATLLIVGERDEQVLLLNEQAAADLVAVREVRIIPGATHLFPEPGALERVAEYAAEWFGRHLESSETRR